MADLDLNAIEASIAQMSEEDVKKQLLEIRTRQKVMQKKYQDPAKQKANRQKKAAEIAALVKRAKEAGFYDSVVEQAKVAASEKLAAEAAEATDDTDEEAA